MANTPAGELTIPAGEPIAGPNLVIFVHVMIALAFGAILHFLTAAGTRTRRDIASGIDPAFDLAACRLVACAALTAALFPGALSIAPIVIIPALLDVTPVVVTAAIIVTAAIMVPITIAITVPPGLI